MADDGGGGFSAGDPGHGETAGDTAHHHHRQPPGLSKMPSPGAGGGLDGASLTSPVAAHTANPFSMSRQHTSLDLDDYFVGPRDISKHSKWPLFLQMHGSILPKMIVPLFFLGGWSTCITCVSRFTNANLGINSLLLTVTGFVVGLALSFRSSTAYERYAEGRRYWAQLINTANGLGRVFWVHARERDGGEADPELGARDTLAKLTALRLVVAFAVALKHKLRFEPYADYEDLAGLVGHLDTYARAATQDDPARAEAASRRRGLLKTAGEFLGISFATSNPRKALKRARRPLGNLPLEILSYLASFADDLVANGQLPVPMQQTLAYNNIAALNDILTGTERVLTTPVPIAYAIAINQITWIYVFLLPFQLYNALGWITIPASVAAGYIILGLLFIGREVENPFGIDVNDLPLDTYCAQIAAEMDLLAAKPPRPPARDWIETLDNKVLWPLSAAGWNVWMHRGDEKLRDALRAKCESAYLALDNSKGNEGENTSGTRQSADGGGGGGGGGATGGKHGGLWGHGKGPSGDSGTA